MYPITCGLVGRLVGTDGRLDQALLTEGVRALPGRR
jgi:hypothetical protein